MDKFEDVSSGVIAGIFTGLFVIIALWAIVNFVVSVVMAPLLWSTFSFAVCSSCLQ